MPVLAVLFGLFVIVNAAASQFFPSLYFQSLKNEKQTIVPYLKSIQPLPQFNSELLLYTNLYGTSIKEGVFYNDSIREKYIKKLEQLSQNNPSSPEINFQLSRLYGQKGELAKSREYLEKARVIDPSL